MKRIGKVFKEGSTDSQAMLILEGNQPLGDDAHKYYDILIRKLRSDPHVQSVQDFWGIRSRHRGRKATTARPHMCR